MKKKISLLVAIAALFTSFMTTFNVNAAFSDVPDTNKYKDAITTLSKLKVINGYDDGTFGPDKEITRAEFTKIIVYMLGYGDMTTPITQFNDVAADHWANANIRVAYDLGIINGFDEVTFKPDAQVTYEQALKMVVCTLGYELHADQLGGYPDGYRQEGVELGLTKGISGLEYTANATRGVVAQIMHNALEIEIMQKKNNTIESTGKNLLNDYLNVYKLKGTIIGVDESTTAECSYKLYPGQLDIKDSKDVEYIIDYTEYNSSFAVMSEYLGQSVQIYYREDQASGEKWLVELDNETVDNDETTVKWSEIGEYNNYTIKYYKDGATKLTSIRLDESEISLRYNGRVVEGDIAEHLSSWLDPNSQDFIYGTVKLIDTGSTGKYNLVDIYDYENIVAYATPTDADWRITDKSVTGNYLILDPDDSDYKFSIKKNNSEIQTTGIAKDDVITYATSLDGELITAYDTAKSVTGTITAMNLEDPVEKTITIDSTEYPITDRFITYIQNKEQKELKTGVSITAYLDYLGSLEWGTITLSSKYYPYAYVIDSAQDGEEYYLKLFAPTSTTLTSFSSSTSYKAKSFRLADNVKLNGKKTSPESVISNLETLAETANPDADIEKADVKLTGINQLIRVGFSSSGELAEIVTINASAAEGSRNEDSGALVRYKQMNAEGKYYVTTSSVKESSKASATMYSIRSSTPMFVIPKDRSASDSYSLKSAITSNTMVSGGQYYLDAYDVSETRYPGCLLVYNTNFKTGTAITYTTAYRLVSDNIQEEYDEKEDDIFEKLFTYNSTTTLTKTNIAPEYENDFKSNVHKGDIILNGTDGDKMADTYMVAVRYEDIREILDGKTVRTADDEGNEIEQTYNWTEETEQTEENNWQKYKFDFRYPRTGLTEPVDNYYITGGNVTNISSRAAMFNLVQAIESENMIYVTQKGFDESGNYDDSDFIEIKVSSSTKYMRYDSVNDEFTPYAQGTESTALTLKDLKQASDYGNACSKILVTYVSGNQNSSTTTPTAKFIVIYE